MNKIAKLIEEISKLTIEEASILINNLENKWNIDSRNNNNFIAKELDNRSEINKDIKYQIVLNEIGPKKLNIIKEIKKITGKNLMESKKIIDKIPAIIKTNLNKKDAEEIFNQFKAAGAKIELKKIND
jgi:large subunit ribosomal protein L7/L12